MAIDANSQVDRRGFLKGAAAGAAGAAAVTVTRNRCDRRRGATLRIRPGRAFTPEQAATDAGAETAPLPDEPDVMTVEDPGSDFMVDVLKKLDFEYIAANPASSFRGLHESFINYGGNTAPEWITCCHEQASVNIANGYYAVAGKPMAVITFAPSGLHHAMMGIFGAFSGAYADLPPRREHPRRQRAATRVRLGPAFRGRSGRRGSRHGEVGRHTGVAAALRRVGRARLQDGDDRATRTGRARRRRHTSGERCRRSIEAPHPKIDAHEPAARATRARWPKWRSCSSLPRIR